MIDKECPICGTHFQTDNKNRKYYDSRGVNITPENQCIRETKI